MITIASLVPGRRYSWKNFQSRLGLLAQGYRSGVAYFWNAFGVDVHIFELQKHLLPIEDEDSSREIEKAIKNMV